MGGSRPRLFSEPETSTGSRKGSATWSVNVETRRSSDPASGHRIAAGSRSDGSGADRSSGARDPPQGSDWTTRERSTSAGCGWPAARHVVAVVPSRSGVPRRGRGREDVRGGSGSPWSDGRGAARGYDYVVDFEERG